MLLEMQLDTKEENIKTQKLMCNIMKDSSTEVSATKNSQNTINDKVNNIIFIQIGTSTTLQNVSADVEKLKSEVDILTGIVSKQAMMIEHLQNFNEHKESRLFKNDIVIQGIETEDSDSPESIKEIVADFFSQTMKIRKNIAIQSAIKLRGQKSTIAVTLRNIRDKSIIFKNVKNIIGSKNSHDENYYVNDRLTLKGQE